MGGNSDDGNGGRDAIYSKDDKCTRLLGFSRKQSPTLKIPAHLLCANVKTQIQKHKPVVAEASSHSTPYRLINAVNNTATAIVVVDITTDVIFGAILITVPRCSFFMFCARFFYV